MRKMCRCGHRGRGYQDVMSGADGLPIETMGERIYILPNGS